MDKRLLAMGISGAGSPGESRKKIWHFLYYCCLAVVIPMAIILSATLYCAFDASWYAQTFSSQNTAKNLNVSPKDLSTLTDHLVNYMDGEILTLQTTVKIKDEEVAFYNPKELQHMMDVKKLLRDVKWIRLGAVGLALLLMLLLCLREGIVSVFKSFIVAGIGAAVFAGALLILTLNDFSNVFYTFHKMLFKNELWMLDPATDRLIQMLPEPFFTAMTYRILIYSGIGIGGILIIGLVGKWYFSKRKGAYL